MHDNVRFMKYRSTRSTRWAVTIALLLTAFVCQRCLLPEDDSEVPKTPGAFDIRVEDISNNGNGSDLRVSFQLPLSGEELSDFRILVVPDADSRGFTLGEAQQVQEGFYIQANTDGTVSVNQLTDQSRDVNGDLIVADVSYRVYILTIADGVTFQNNQLSFPSFSIVLDDRPDNPLSIINLDVGNDGNAADIRVTFVQPENRSGLLGYGFMIVPEEEVATFDFEQADAVPDARKYTVAPGALPEMVVTLPASLPDVNGDAIASGLNYRVVIQSLADGVVAFRDNLAQAFRALELREESYIVTITEPFSGAGQMIMGSDGYLYVSDVGNSLTRPNGRTVWRIDPETGERTVFTDKVNAPMGITTSPAGELYVANFYSGEIFTFDLDMPGSEPTLYAAFPWSPSYLQYRGTLHVMDQGSEGRYIIDFGSPGVSDSTRLPIYKDPQPVIDDYTQFYFIGGTTYLLDQGDNVVYRDVSSGEGFGAVTVVSPFIDTPGTVGGVADLRGRLCISLRDRHQIAIVASNVEFTTLVGSGIPGKEDGSLRTATLSYPKELVSTPEGDVIYVQDRQSPNIGGEDIAPVVIRKIVLVN